MGFVDGTRAYGSFGTWHADNIDLGVDIDNALIETTPVNRDNALYLWRVPSDNPDDAKMMSALSLAGHDIINSAYIGADRMEFNQGLALPDIASNSMIFSNRTTIDGVFSAGASSVAGMLSSDSKNLEISGTATVADTAKFSTSAVSNELGISQPALSKQIGALEQDLGVKLFDRGTNPVSLTPAGAYFIDEAKRMVFAEDQLLRTMEQFKDGKAGRLTIGVSPFRCVSLMPRVVN